jgi:hypothetical protein
MDIISYYIGIGLVLTLPLISLAYSNGEVETVSTKEVFLTVFLWPWLWALLGKMIFNFIKKELCIKIK